MSAWTVIHVGSRRRRVLRAPLPLAAVLILLTGVMPAAGGQEEAPAQQEPSQEPAPAVQEVRLEEAPPEARRTARSLSAFAASTRLQRPEGAEDQPLVISNENLDDLSRGASLSEGATGSPMASRMGRGFGQQERLEREWQRRLRDQEAKVLELQERLAEVDGKIDDYRRAGVYYSSAHYRPGGVQDPVDSFRLDLEKQLAAEQERLESLQQDAVKDGVRP